MDYSDLVTDRFLFAAEDFRYLDAKGYPKKGSLKLVGDRYRLSSDQRSALMRGVQSESVSQERRSKLIPNPAEISGQPLFLDGYNILITLVSYLAGTQLYIAMDGLLRDTAESRSSLRNKVLFNKALDLLFLYLAADPRPFGPDEIICFLDSPVSKSRETAGRLNRRFRQNGLNGKTCLVSSPDRELKMLCDKGVIATSDSDIVDGSRRVFDLARWILDYHYQPVFIDLGNL